jgi:hypothetical protein
LASHLRRMYVTPEEIHPWIGRRIKVVLDLRKARYNLPPESRQSELIAAIWIQDLKPAIFFMIFWLSSGVPVVLIR